MARKQKSDFTSQSFAKRLNTMMKADGRRMFTSSMFYIMAGIALVMPILILCMTTMVSGTTVADPTTGVETTMEAFTNVWQIIGSESGTMGMNMDMTAMCNINLVYFMAGIFLCLFVAEDFQSGTILPPRPSTAFWPGRSSSSASLWALCWAARSPACPSPSARQGSRAS